MEGANSMKNVLAFSLNGFLNLLEISTLYLLSSCFFQNKCQGVQLCLCWAVLFSINVVILILVEELLAIKVLLMAAISTAWVKYVFQENIIKCSVVSVLFMSLIHI